MEPEVQVKWWRGSEYEIVQQGYRPQCPTDYSIGVPGE
jgi:hypothetical protein